MEAALSDTWRDRKKLWRMSSEVARRRGLRPLGAPNALSSAALKRGVQLIGVGLHGLGRALEFSTHAWHAVEARDGDLGYSAAANFYVVTMSNLCLDECAAFVLKTREELD